jgi:hypothetical protein
MQQQPISSPPSKRRTYLGILLPGVLAGTAITLLAWLQKWTPLRAPHGLYAALFWVGVVSVLVYGILLQRRKPFLSRLWVIAAITIAIGMDWLFPETLGPGCGGMPRAFAHWENQCTTTCTTVCTWWVPLSDPTCAAQPHQPWDIGCCWTYGQSCTTSCSNVWVDDPPTVSGAVSCSTLGTNGWCRGGAALDLTASDPQNYPLILSGTIGGTPFTCSGSSCSQALPDGSGSASFTASASGGGNLSSSPGSAAYQVDSTVPSLALSIPAANGSNGWFTSGPVTATASGTDTTSGVGNVSINGGGAIFTAASDGVYPLTATATDNAGNSTTTSGTIQIDSVPPSLSVSASPVDGNGGWYVSPAVVTATVNDATSGVADVQYRVDGGAWQDGSTVTISTDGSHMVEFQARDQAGNTTTASQTVAVDTTPPQSGFTSPSEGSTTYAHGRDFVMSGASSDATSGLSGAQISLDGGTTWQPISINSDGSWSYTWDTTTASDGPHGVLVSATDQAGNQEHTARITVIVANLGPSVSISNSFSVDQDVPVQFSPSILPITGARILVSDSGGHTRTYSYSPTSLPTSFQWDGLWDDGTRAVPGDYQVEASAWDMFGNTGDALGTVQVPPPSPTPNHTPIPTATPPLAKPVRPSSTPAPLSFPKATHTPTLSPTNTPTATITPPPPATPTRLPATPFPPVPVHEAAPKSQSPAQQPVLIWPALGFVALLAVLAASSLSDPRPQALHQLAKILESIQDKPS